MQLPKRMVSILPNNLRFFQISARMGSDFVDFFMFVDYVQEWVSILRRTPGTGMGFINFAGMFVCLNYYGSSSLKEKLCGGRFLVCWSERLGRVREEIERKVSTLREREKREQIIKKSYKVLQ
jgi:hypothetical protein